MCIFCRSLFVLLCFLLSIALSALLRFTASDYPFDIVKHFFFMYMCVRGIDFACDSTMSLLDIGTVPPVWYFYFSFIVTEMLIEGTMFIWEKRKTNTFDPNFIKEENKYI